MVKHGKFRGKCEILEGGEKEWEREGARCGWGQISVRFLSKDDWRLISQTDLVVGFPRKGQTVWHFLSLPLLFLLFSLPVVFCGSLVSSFRDGQSMTLWYPSDKKPCLRVRLSFEATQSAFPSSQAYSESGGHEAESDNIQTFLAQQQFPL